MATPGGPAASYPGDPADGADDDANTWIIPGSVVGPARPGMIADIAMTGLSTIKLDNFKPNKLHNNTIQIINQQGDDSIQRTRWIISAGMGTESGETNYILDKTDKLKNGLTYSQTYRFDTLTQVKNQIRKEWRARPTPMHSQIYDIIASLHNRIQDCEQVDLQCYKNH